MLVKFGSYKLDLLSKFSICLKLSGILVSAFVDLLGLVLQLLLQRVDLALKFDIRHFKCLYLLYERVNF